MAVGPVQLAGAVYIAAVTDSSLAAVASSSGVNYGPISRKGLKKAGAASTMANQIAALLGAGG
jgi:hypothetical protein